MSVKINALTKIYGQQKAVNNLSFEVSKGEVLGFLGPNGAGKTTTMKIATGYLPPSSGSIEVCGLDVMQHSLKVRQKIGYLPENNPLYNDLYVHEYLAFSGSLYGLKGKELKLKVQDVVEMCGLSKEQHKNIKELSKGYKQRVGLANALIHDPEVLILDEPTTGLDPNQIIEIRNLIKTVSQEKTVILSTHIMQEVEAICDRFVIINNGELLANDRVDDVMKGNKTKIIEVEFASEVDENELLSIDGVGEVRRIDETMKYQLLSQDEEDIRNRIFEFSKEKGYSLLGLSQGTGSLEEVFKDLTNKK